MRKLALAVALAFGLAAFGAPTAFAADKKAKAEKKADKKAAKPAKKKAAAKK